MAPIGAALHLLGRHIQARFHDRLVTRAATQVADETGAERLLIDGSLLELHFGAVRRAVCGEV